MKLAKGSLSWIITSFLLTVIFAILTVFLDGLLKIITLSLSSLFLLFLVMLLIFFRDPERKTGKGIVAPADGVIRETAKEEDKDVGECIKISTFMNFHNVHVNRMPIDGTIKDIIHYDGAHIPAFKKESDKNERVVLLIKTKIGIIKIIQIAGTLARRIIPYVKKEDRMKKGERIGIIRLGSRVDIYLPSKKIKSINAKVRDKIKAGEDTIAEIHD